METVHIQAEAFFELIKIKDQSMWDIFANMIDGTEKHLIFLNPQNQVVFDYLLPTTIDQLQEDKKTFSKAYADKITQSKTK